MDNDDLPIGRVLSRREAVRLLTMGGMAAAGGATLLARFGTQASGQAPACVVRPELEEGPYFVDGQLNRTDLTIDPVSGVATPGLPLSLALSITKIANGRCEPLPDAVIDLWQCDAAGIYSGVSGRGQANQAEGGKSLRGFQTTDAQGRASFMTIYPGWYQGRAVHIHFKIRTTTAPSGAYEFTSQFFFDEALNDRVHAQAPYNRRPRRDTLNQNDGIFRSGGAQLTLAPTTQGAGMAAAFALAMDLSDTSAGQPDGGRGRGRGPGRGRGRG
jgi:protocatechuate 3,4-dioxygenase beta subunit